MMTAISPRSSGVYQIYCVPTGKIYIGSAVDLWGRWEKHRSSLRRGNHRNVYLQNAWNKYGEANFVFSVLELVKKSDLLSVEQLWLNQTGCFKRTIGFNIYDVAGSPGDKFARVWEGFVDPNGKEIIITNLSEFCRQHKLDFPSMHRLAKGKSKLKSYKGWSHRNSVRQRDYVKSYNGFITPDGRIAGLITNLAAFCREHGLDNTHMVAVAHGRIYSHHGWTYDNSRQNRRIVGLPKKYVGFVNPDGEHIVITNLRAFCLEHGLEPVHMHELINGKRKSHKGWTWREENEDRRKPA